MNDFDWVFQTTTSTIRTMHRMAFWMSESDSSHAMRSATPSFHTKGIRACIQAPVATPNVTEVAQKESIQHGQRSSDSGMLDSARYNIAAIYSGPAVDKSNSSKRS
ncbi:hypothetical protein EV175_003478 [Coemansia sp. RSA 1933]|nr:hypothetical protein EV175_003478 [Coemansia sp. RSA 1933]